MLVRRAHPRSRGEHVPTNQRLGRRSGSSPLTRGTRPRRDARRYRRRLIPAHAGNTLLGEARVVEWEAHPRSRGEHVSSRAVQSRLEGSSPLTRGTPVGFRCGMLDWRLIPAHAGNTLGALRIAHLPWAHPRSRGEHWLFYVSSCGVGGSSPLTRGTLLLAQRQRGLERLIPAHAGNTSGFPSGDGDLGAHPRSRGEHCMNVEFASVLTGSSPLTRGTPCRVCTCVRCRGLIPAHAGNTRKARAQSTSVRAHPRSRGEHRRRGGLLVVARGSSPLTRGTPAHDRAVRGAGWAHPRSRGEHLFIKSGSGANDGSSPLTRGTPRRILRDVGRSGLIPAHAGNTLTSLSLGLSLRAHPRSRGEHNWPTVGVEPSSGSSPLTRGTR